MNLLIEQSVKEWLESDATLNAAIIHCGQSDDEIPNDGPLITVSCEDTSIQAPTLYLATVRLIIASPCVMEDSLSSHRAIVASLRTILKNAATISDYFPAPLQCVGAAISNIAESQSNQKWLSSISLTVGIVES